MVPSAVGTLRGLQVNIVDNTLYLIVLLAVTALLAPLLKVLAGGHVWSSSSKPSRAAVRSSSEAPDAADGATARREAPAPLPLPAGYSPDVEQLRKREFQRLQGRVYADYAGAAPYSELLLAEVLRELSSSLHGNPHSEAGWGECRSAAADAARWATLRMCNADPEQYACIFTAGATAALKLVGESFPWSPDSAFLYLRDNHNSVLGIRQLAAQHGAACTAAVQLRAVGGGGGGGGGGGETCGWQLAPCSEAAAARLWAAAAASTAASSSGACLAEHLFAFPLESNFSGARYDPGLVAAVQSGRLRCCSTGRAGSPELAGSAAEHGALEASAGDHGAALPQGHWRVLLDCAKACASAPPDLAACPADFAVLSYYKIFGYPTGLGALLVRKDALSCLQRRYFSGGTVTVSLADEPFHSLRAGPAGWEDGTPAFLDFPAVAAGMRFIERLGGFSVVAAHAGSVAASLARQLSALRHSNGARVCVLYGAHAEAERQLPPKAQQEPEPCQQQQGGHGQASRPAAPAPGVVGQGPVVAFNLQRPDGSFVGYREVEKLASLSGIHLRTGCLCNPGACAAALGLSAADMRANFEAGHVCWDERDVIGGRPTGVVRASFGYASSLADAAVIVDLVRRFFVDHGQETGAAAPGAQQAAGRRHALLRTWGAEGAAAAVSKSGAGADAALAPATPTAAATGAAAGPGEVAAQALCTAAEAPLSAEAGLPCGRAAPDDSRPSTAGIQALWVYPIKSCRGFSPPAWPVGPTGLAYDRCWVLVDAASGSALRLKRHPALASISAHVDLERRLLLASAPGEPEVLQVPLPDARLPWLPPKAEAGGAPEGGSGDGGADLAAAACSVSVCAQTACAQRAGSVAGGEAVAAAWFSRVLCMPCRLVQQAGTLQQHPAKAQQAAAMASGGQASHGQDIASLYGSGGSGPDGPRISGGGGGTHGSGRGGGSSFANEAQLLVVGAASLADLAARSASGEAPEVFAQRFRPNLVVGGTAAYAEDSWRQLSIAASIAAPAPAPTAATPAAAAPEVSQPVVVQLTAVGPCTRCDMICADPLTGRRTGPEPLLTLASYRRSRGRITFGLLMDRCQQPQQAQQAAAPQQGQVPSRHGEQQQGPQQQAGGQAAPQGAAAPWVPHVRETSMAWLAVGMHAVPVL